MELSKSISAKLVIFAEIEDLFRFLKALKKDLAGKGMEGIGIMSIGIGVSISSRLEAGWRGNSEPFLWGSSKPESLGLFFLISEGL